MNAPTDRTLLDEISQLTEVVRQSRQYFQEQFQQAQTLAATSQAIQSLATTLEQMGGSQSFQELLHTLETHQPAQLNQLLIQAEQERQTLTYHLETVHTEQQAFQEATQTLRATLTQEYEGITSRLQALLQSSNDQIAAWQGQLRSGQEQSSALLTQVVADLEARLYTLGSTLTESLETRHHQTTASLESSAAQIQQHLDDSQTHLTRLSETLTQQLAALSQQGQEALGSQHQELSSHLTALGTSLQEDLELARQTTLADLNRHVQELETRLHTLTEDLNQHQSQIQATFERYQTAQQELHTLATHLSQHLATEQLHHQTSLTQHTHTLVSQLQSLIADWEYRHGETLRDLEDRSQELSQSLTTQLHSVSQNLSQQIQAELEQAAATTLSTLETYHQSTLDLEEIGQSILEHFQRWGDPDLLLTLPATLNQAQTLLTALQSEHQALTTVLTTGQATQQHWQQLSQDMQVARFSLEQTLHHSHEYTRGAQTTLATLEAFGQQLDLEQQSLQDLLLTLRQRGELQSASLQEQYQHYSSALTAQAERHQNDAQGHLQALLAEAHSLHSQLTALDLSSQASAAQLHEELHRSQTQYHEWQAQVQTLQSNLSHQQTEMLQAAQETLETTFRRHHSSFQTSQEEAAQALEHQAAQLHRDLNTAFQTALSDSQTSLHAFLERTRSELVAAVTEAAIPLVTEAVTAAAQAALHHRLTPYVQEMQTLVEQGSQTMQSWMEQQQHQTHTQLQAQVAALQGDLSQRLQAEITARLQAETEQLSATAFTLESRLRETGQSLLEAHEVQARQELDLVLFSQQSRLESHLNDQLTDTLNPLLAQCQAAAATCQENRDQVLRTIAEFTTLQGSLPMSDPQDLQTMKKQLQEMKVAIKAIVQHLLKKRP